MENYEFNLVVRPESTVHICKPICDYFMGFIRSIMEEYFPQYINEISIIRFIDAMVYIDDTTVVFTAKNTPYLNAAMIGTLDDVELINIGKQLVGDKNFVDYNDLIQAFGKDKMNYNNFIYAGPVNNGKLSAIHLAEIIARWLDNEIIPQTFEHNERRILDVIPAPPNYDAELVLQNVFLIEEKMEGEIECKQGTCFYLKNVGFVTCAHVLTIKSVCIDPHNGAKTYSIRVISKDEDIDLAILDIPDLIKRYNLNGLEKGDLTNIKQLTHVAVAGYPNYRYNDSGIFSAGFVIGFRTIRDIRRILINAPIIFGNSGGPVVDGDNKVIGIAVTGADFDENADKTENHAVIPIDAIDRLLKR